MLLCCEDQNTSDAMPHRSTTLYEFQQAALANDLPRLSATTWSQLNASIANSATTVRQNVNATKQGTGPRALLT